MFGVGYGAQLVIKLLSSLTMLKKKPQEVKNLLWGPGSFGLALFLSLYNAVYRVSDLNTYKHTHTHFTQTHTTLTHPLTHIPYTH